MSLQKGFLRPKFNLTTLRLNQKEVFIGLFFWLLFTFTVYSFLVCLKELYRYTSIWFDSEHFLLLSPAENYFYNFVFACYAGVLTFSVISNHWLRRSTVLSDIQQYKKAAIFHDKVSLSWYSIYWLAKMGLIFSTLISMMGVFTELSLFPDYVWVFALLLLNLYFHQWLTLRRVYRNSILSWMLGVFLIILITSSLLAMINLIPYQKLNESVLKNTVSYHVKVELPTIESGTSHGRRWIMENIYIGFDKIKSDSGVVLIVKYFGGRSVSRIAYNDLEKFVLDRKSGLDEYNANDITWRLNIDKHVKMVYVKNVLKEFRRLNEKRIQFAAEDKTRLGTYGLSRRLLPMDFDYSILKAENSLVKTIIIRDSCIYWEDKKIRLDELADVMTGFLQINSDKAVLEIDVDDTSEFGIYLGVCDQFVSVVNGLRSSWILKNYHKTILDSEYLDLEEQEIYDSARWLYPMAIIDK